MSDHMSCYYFKGLPCSNYFLLQGLLELFCAAHLAISAVLSLYLDLYFFKEEISISSNVLIHNHRFHYF